MTSIGKTCCNKKYKQVSEMIVVEESCRIQLSYRVLGVKSTTILILWRKIHLNTLNTYVLILPSELPVKLICRSGILRVECIRYKYLVGNPVYIARPGVH